MPKLDGAKLRTKRFTSGTSVATLAAQIKCTIWHVYKLESGDSQPSAETYGLIKKALRAKDKDLLADPEEGSAA